MKKKNKYYLVLNRVNGYRHGAFPYTPEGLELAKKYIKKTSKDEDDLYIKEK